MGTSGSIPMFWGQVDLFHLLPCAVEISDLELWDSLTQKPVDGCPITLPTVCHPPSTRPSEPPPAPRTAPGPIPREGKRCDQLCWLVEMPTPGLLWCLVPPLGVSLLELDGTVLKLVESAHRLPLTKKDRMHIWASEMSTQAKKGCHWLPSLSERLGGGSTGEGIPSSSWQAHERKDTVAAICQGTKTRGWPQDSPEAGKSHANWNGAWERPFCVLQPAPPTS
ncbi:uncharacterized protein LOC118721433 isoform X5 [Pipistrellus kuhlii]|uniref:uncharacterized protein LOC118721433 isoform X5 n=1 Tax=Pipistrellus kuhlii TaxID=59472 RepID=UPI001E26F923|nr:uncharacterized protein LOC118721433 isoform X5 [Pipistrellus kuhlii]